MKFIKALLLIMLIISTECRTKKKLKETDLVSVESAKEKKKEERNNFLKGFLSGMLSVLFGNSIANTILPIIASKVTGGQNEVDPESIDPECDYGAMVKDLLGLKNQMEDQSQNFVETLPEIHLTDQFECEVIEKDEEIKNKDIKQKKICVGLLGNKLKEIKQKLKDLKDNKDAKSKKEKEDLKVQKDLLTQKIKENEPGFFERAKNICVRIESFWKKGEVMKFAKNIKNKFKNGIEVSFNILKCVAKQQIQEAKKTLQKANKNMKERFKFAVNMLIQAVSYCFNKIGRILQSVYTIIDQIGVARENQKKKRYYNFGEAVGKVVGTLVSLIKQALLKKKMRKMK